MKILGVIFVVTSSVIVGIHIGKILKQRCSYIRQMIDAFQVLENEISFGSTPLPEAFMYASEATEGKLKSILNDVSTRMTKNCWKTPKRAMEEALLAVSDGFGDDILIDLAERVGKYDVQTQLAGIHIAKQRAEQTLRTLESEYGAKSRTYRTLSVCAGMAVAILLL